MNKRILSLVLALVMVLGTFAVVSAEEAKVPEYTTQKQKIQWLVDNKVVEGHKVNASDDDMDLDLEGTLTREQATKLIIHLVGKYDLAKTLQGVMKPFPDVDLDRWSNGVISVARTEKGKNGQPIVVGFEDGNFKPEKEVTYAELATMLVRIVKDDLTDKMVANAVWATSWMRWANEEGILKGLTIVNSDAPINRADAFEMIFNGFYELGRYNGNRAEFGVNIGIVSKLQAGKLEINQDPEKVYNFTYKTQIVNNVSGSELAANAVIPGSLVRYIVDADNNLEKVLVVSTPEVGMSTNMGNYSGWHRTNRNRIFGLGGEVFGAEKGLLVLDSAYRPNTGTIEVYKYVNEDKKDFEGKVEVTADTRVFVADPRNNALKEYDSVEDALRIFNANKDTFKGFVIYDSYRRANGTPRVNEATVLVFTETDKANYSDRTYRVRYDVNSHYFAGLEEANNGKIVSLNFAGVNFLPGSYNLNNMNVVKFGNPFGHGDAYAKTIINYATANVYYVERVADRYIVLRDKYNGQAEVNWDVYTKVFNDGRGLAKGDHVQLSVDTEGNYAKVVSVVDKALKGVLTFGIREDLTIETGKVASYEANSAHNGYGLLHVYDDVDGVPVNHRTFLVSNTDAELVAALENIEGAEVELRVYNGYFYGEGIRYADVVKVTPAKTAETK